MAAEIDTDLFAGLDAGERRALLARLRPRHFAPGAVILHQGQWSRTLHIIREGAATVTVGDSFGQRREVARLGPGEIVGEMAVLTGRPHSATVTAAGPAATLALSHDDFLALLGEQLDHGARHGRLQASVAMPPGQLRAERVHAQGSRAREPVARTAPGDQPLLAVARDVAALDGRWTRGDERWLIDI